MVLGNIRIYSPPSTRSGPSSVVHVVEQIDNIINKEYSDYHYWENLYL